MMRCLLIVWLLMCEVLGYRHVSAFVSPTTQRRSSLELLVTPAYNEAENAIDERKSHHESNELNLCNIKSRRQMFGDCLRAAATTATASCGCILHPYSAHALAALTTPPPDLLSTYDVPRNAVKDSLFAAGMASGMVQYEREAFPKKKVLFSKLFESLSNVNEPTVVEVGMGSFPNAIFYEGYKGIDIIGVDPNDRMAGYAKDAASKSGLLKRYGDSLRIFHGVSEALPFADNTIDAVVCSLTLCSVVDPARSVAEIRRVLKQGGKFLFWEHVLSQTDPEFAQFQIERTPRQVENADGCHLDRKTGDTILAAGFSSVDLEYAELENGYLIKPTVLGIATK